MPRGGKRKGAGRPKFNDDNPTTKWVVKNVLIEIERDGLGRYQRKMAKQSSFLRVKKVGIPIEIEALEAIRNTVELKEEIGRLTLEIARLRESDPGAVEIGRLKADLEETRDVSVPDAWREKSEKGGIRVFIEGGIKPNHVDMSRYFKNVAARSMECPTGLKNGMDRYQIKELWNRYHAAEQKYQNQGNNIEDG